MKTTCSVDHFSYCFDDDCLVHIEEKGAVGWMPREGRRDGGESMRWVRILRIRFLVYRRLLGVWVGKRFLFGKRIVESIVGLFTWST